MPNHFHSFGVLAANGTTIDPRNNTLAASSDLPYMPSGNNVQMAGAAISNAGGGQAHENMQPYLAVNFCIALQGLFPSRN
jgi:microcystin-dependent protein